jgi:ferritin
MLKDNLKKAFSDQINAEFYSAYLYLDMSAYADRLGFKGIANWMRVQAKEEMAHATHMFDHVLDRGEQPKFAPVQAPPGGYEGVKDLFDRVLAHERNVTELINGIASIAVADNDHASYQFISWYVNEQVEEESNVDEIVSKLRIIGDNTVLLYNLDQELATRTFTDPFASTASTGGTAA